ncbi:MAG: HAMP domain-containing histidine kinase [Chloroflexi bacterium]|nr:HAMP domain-containing histidine kinase [Chloroflexota bacterium]
MNRSLTLKLIRAFLIVSLLGTLLAVGMTRWLLTKEFNELVLDQSQTTFIQSLTSYYLNTGSWDGVLEYVVQLSGEPGQPRPTPPEQSLQQPRPQQLPPLGQPPFVFTLADQDGIIIVPAGKYRLGNHLPEDDLGQGEPVELDGVRIGTILPTGDPPPLGEREQRYLTRANQALLYGGLGATAVSLIVGIFLARSLTHPLRELKSGIRTLAKGNLPQQLPVRTQDELGELAAAFNQMSSDLEEANQLRRQLTADIAHDLRTPLTVIGGYIESMQDGVLQATPARLKTIQQEVEHLQHLVNDLQILARADAGELTLNLQQIVPHSLLERIVNTYQHQADQQQITLQLNAANNLPSINVDEERMAQLLGNLVSNALRHTPSGGTITLAATPITNHIQLTISDTGDGIPPEHLPHIFHRFYRADQSRGGESGESGLGLAIAKSIVEAHQGEISVSSAGHNQGTTFTIKLPILGSVGKMM